MNRTTLTQAMVLLGVLLLSGASRASVMLNIDPRNNQLLGASGIDVNGVLYDVAFVDGTCQSVFSGCNESSDFTFTTSQDAEAATDALMNQVFAPNPLYDTSPAFTFGISDPDEGLLITPWGLLASNPGWYLGVIYRNTHLAVGQVPFLFGNPDEILLNLQDPVDADFAARDFAVLAVWSPTPLATQGVPLPGTMLLLLAGLSGAGFLRRVDSKG